MGSEAVLLKLLEYSPIVAILGIGAYVFWKEIQKKDSVILEERARKDKELKEERDSMGETINSLHAELRVLYTQNLEVIRGSTQAMESFKRGQDKQLEVITEQVSTMNKLVNDLADNVHSLTEKVQGLDQKIDGISRRS